MSDIALNPSTFTEFVGQEPVRQGLESMMRATRQHGDVLEHILLTGPPGFGKRALARMIANAMGVNIRNTSGLVIGKAGELAGLLTSLEKADVLFIDEIDRVQPDILEHLYSSLRNFELNIIIDEGPNARSLRLQLPKFTLVGASTHADKIGARLLACFGKTFQFDRYTAEELQTILLRYAETIGVSIDPRAALEIAAYADGSSVAAKNLFRRVRDFSEVRDCGEITHSIAERALTVFLREVNKGDFVQCTETVPLPIPQKRDHPRFAALDPEAPNPSFEASLRPSTFSEFAGQQTVCERLQIMIDAAQHRGDVLDHTLLSGDLGLGKTTLAHVIANAMGVNIVAADAAKIVDTAHLSRLITPLERGDILLIDEIHRLNPALEKDLHSAMEEFYIDVILDDGPQARSLRVQLPKFTLIGTTPSEGMISASLRSRFGATFRLFPYSEAELLAAIIRSAGVLGVAIDECEALDFATRSYGSPRTANNNLRLAMPRLRLMSAFARSKWHEVPSLVTDIFWALAEARPDFEELPNWIIDAEAAISNVEPSQKATRAVAQARAIIRSLANRYGDEADRIAVTQWELKFSNSDPQAATFLSDEVEQAKHFRKGLRRLPIAIHDDEVCVGKHARISFNRTLRIPEDGKAYPLPAGFGRLPVLRVEEYADRIPESWLEQGGFIIPLYQREALFLEFSGVQWRPMIAKVAVGKVNAISGKEHDLKIRSHRQDYVVVPDQRWLDGINSGDGTVSQFVAMPLGKGYTIEAQVTDEEKYGGFQLAIFDPKPNRFPEQDPQKQRAAAEDRKQRSAQATQQELLRKKLATEAQKRRAQQDLLHRLPETSAQLIRAVKKQHYREAAQTLGISEEEILVRLENLRSHFVEVLGENAFEGIIPSEHLKKLPPDLPAASPVAPPPTRPMPDIRFMPATGDDRRQFMPSTDSRPPAAHSARREQEPSEPEPPLEMGIARGGTIKQQIFEDTYGAESWDESTFRDVVIHIVNSEVYHQITGREAPPSPISIEHYQHYNIPWYSAYAEKAPSLSPAAIFRRILGAAQIEKHRGIVKVEDCPKWDIQPERIVRIHTPTMDQRFRSVLDRAVRSSVDGRHRIAAREASLAIDLFDQHPLPFLIRAVSNHHLGHHADAEADASACLMLHPNNILALNTRAFSLLALGETLLAKNDAEIILASQPDDQDGLLVRAKANLDLLNYKEAFEDANKLLEHDSSNAQAMRIKAEAMTKLS